MDNRQAFKFCRYCGSPLKPGARFCDKCGRPLNAPQPAGQPGYHVMPQSPNSFVSPPGNYHNTGSGYQGRPPGGVKRKKSRAGLIITLCLVVITVSVLGYFVLSGRLNIPWITSRFGSVDVSLGKAEQKQPDESRVIQVDDWGEAPANQVIIIFKDGVSRNDAESRIKSIGGSIVGEMEIINLYQVETDGRTEEDLKSALKRAESIQEVESAFPNVAVYAEASSGVPCGPLSDPFYKVGQNGRPNEIIGLQNAWNIIKASGINLNEVKVGVMDTALYGKSDEINGEGKITGDKTMDPARDKNGNMIFGGLNHGTMVTHVIAADGKNGGMSGTASILGSKMQVNVRDIYTDDYVMQTDPDPNDPAVFTLPNGKSYVSSTLIDLQKMVESNATVINCSFGNDKVLPNTPVMAGAYKKFFEYMAEKKPNVIFIASAGNEASKDKTKGGIDGTNHYPGGLKLSNVITVGAVDNEGNRAFFSDFATGNGEVSISAPGVNLPLGYGNDGKIVNLSGTSFAAAEVSGAAALLKSINPNLSAEDIKKLLTGTASRSVKNKDKSVPIEPGMGSGVLNIEDAVFKAANDLKGGNLKKADLLALCSIDVTATGGPKDFKVTASISKVGDKPAPIKIELLGEGVIGGGSGIKNLSSPGEVSWNVTIVKNSSSVKITRLDTGG